MKVEGLYIPHYIYLITKIVFIIYTTVNKIPHSLSSSHDYNHYTQSQRKEVLNYNYIIMFRLCQCLT